MKTVRYISFIPAFFISLFIAKILVKLIIYLISFLNQFRGIEPNFLWIDFIVHVFSVFIAISASIEIYPNQNKKIPIIICGIIILTISVLSNYLIFMDEFKDETPIRIKIKTILTTIINFLVYSYILFNYKKNNYES